MIKEPDNKVVLVVDQVEDLYFVGESNNGYAQVVIQTGFRTSEKLPRSRTVIRIS